jgi:exodeoxyribonuclease VII large subunit
MLAPRGVLTVSQLTGAVKDILEAGFPSVTVEGEITGLRSTSGKHLYFSLKDDSALLKVVWFSWNSKGAEPPADGQQVRITGRLAVYEAQGVYQLVVSTLEAVGLGDLLAALERLKRQLEAEGLFAIERKRPLPPFPTTIGLVTSATGAAVQDMLRIFEQFGVRAVIRIFPVAVQGTEAPVQIAAALRYASKHLLAEVLVVGRGGGSVEDLLAFSDERVIRAIADSEVPVISAVGHEIDSPLSDFAADTRAATPTAAAELLSRPWAAVEAALAQVKTELTDAAQARLDRTKLLLADYKPDRLHETFERVLQPYYQRFDFAQDALKQAWNDRLAELKRRVELGKTALEALNPKAVLERGYVFVTKPDGSALPRSRELTAGDLVTLQFSDGTAQARVEEVSHEEF